MRLYVLIVKIPVYFVHILFKFKLSK